MGFNRNMIRTVEHALSQDSISFLREHWKGFFNDNFYVSSSAVQR